MNVLSAQDMSGLVTLPYRRGAELMEIPLGAGAGGFANIPPYDFSEYRARYQSDPPQPKYVLFPKKKTGGDELEVEVGFSSGGATQTALVKIPARTPAGISFLIPLPPGADAKLRLQHLRLLVPQLFGVGADNWGIVALLGNISKLNWVLGREKDEIRERLLDIHQQRFRAFARGHSLDQLGSDLHVPRFPPREHSFDRNTLALYHLNETTTATGPVADETSRFGSTGHPGVNAGAQSGVNGKFGTAFLFPGAGAAGAVTIAHDADFDLAVGRSFTAEAFVKPESFDDTLLRIVIIKRARETAAALLDVGWSLSLGNFHGITNNVMWAVSDGVTEVKVFADLNIADGKIHHLAGTIDRTAQRARLFVDGEERASGRIGTFGAISNTEPVRLGRSATGNQFFGVIDEVRLSNIARVDFHPVLGEGDEAYRQRLGIFERWLLPTPGNLLRTINELVQINGDQNSFILVEKDRPSSVASKVVRIVPGLLPAGSHIDRDGDQRTRESDVSGVAGTDTEFIPIYLHRHDRVGVDYTGVEDNRRMQAVTRNCLDALLDLLTGAVVAGRLFIRKSFAAEDAGLHSVGRALRLTHETLPLDRLGAFVHRAGFDFVQNNGVEIYASTAPGEKLEVIIEPPLPAETPPPPGVDVLTTRGINLHIAPETLPVNGLVDWTLIQCGAGRAHFERHTSDATTLRTPITARQRLRLVADAPGEVTVRVEYTLNRRTVSGTRTILISIDALADNQTIAANGDLEINEAAAVGTPESIFNPVYLITSNAAVSFGGAPNNRRMQIALERPFKRFLDLVQGSGGALNQLSVLKGFDPAGPGLHRVGRAIRMGHNVLNPATLGALAHRAGFGFVRRTGSEIFAAVAADEKIEIVQASDLSPLKDELEAGASIAVRVRFSDPLPAPPPAPPFPGNFNWSLTHIGNGSGSLDSVLRPAVKFTPRSPGLLALSVTFLEPDAQSTFPYTFEIRLNNALNVPGTIIPKHQYDLLMNVLNYFHPIGIEVVTQNIREHVVELQGNLLNAFPGYTYPDFRA